MATIAPPAPRLLLTPKEAATVLAVGEADPMALTMPAWADPPGPGGRSVRYTMDCYGHGSKPIRFRR